MENQQEKIVYDLGVRTVTVRALLVTALPTKTIEYQ